ncbi:hypothetical protein Q7F05_16895 [Pseudomonas sp. Lb2C1-1]|uniref:hypothetical protein n=1 Tax=Pseudomonas TaxID=286 RepID=UPI00391CFB77
MNANSVYRGKPEVVDTKKNNLRILVVENRPFQLMETLSKLGQVGYFNTFPALSCLEALIVLNASRKPYDIILFSTELNAAELNMLIVDLSIRKLARYFLLVGDPQPGDLCAHFAHEASRPEFRCLGVLNKPVSSDKLAAILARIPTSSSQRSNTLMPGRSEASTPSGIPIADQNHN